MYCSGARHGTEHSPGVSLSAAFQLSDSTLLDESESETGSADEEEVRCNDSLTDLSSPILLPVFGPHH